MTGAPREAFADDDFVIVRGAAVRALGSWELAGCFQRIAWRCRRDGFWKASMDEIAEQIFLSPRTAKRLTIKLRELGWITGERENPYDATLTWRVVWRDENAGQTESDDVALPGEPAGQTESDDVTLPERGQAVTSESDDVALPGVPKVALSESAKVTPSESAKVALSSSQTGKRTTEISSPAADASATNDEGQLALVDVSTEPTEPKLRFDRKVTIPADFTITSGMREWWAKQNHPTVDSVAETENFIDHSRANDVKHKDWEAAWRYWMRNAQKFSRGRGTVTKMPQRSADPQARSRHRDALGGG